MTVLRQRMLDDMRIRNLAAETQTSYLRQVAKFARYHGQSPELLGPEDIRTYQLHLLDDHQLAPTRLAPAWVKPLRAQYARFEQAYSADWVDVEKVWRKQRARWQSKAAPRRQEPPARAVPPRAPDRAAGAANKAQQQSGYDRSRIARSRIVASIT